MLRIRLSPLRVRASVHDTEGASLGAHEAVQRTEAAVQKAYPEARLTVGHIERFSICHVSVTWKVVLRRKT